MSLKFCTNCGHQLKDDEKVCPCCGATILNDDLSIDEQLDILKNDEIVDNIKVKDDRKIEPEVKIKDDRVSDESIVKVNDDRTYEEEDNQKVNDNRVNIEEAPIKVKDDRPNSINENTEENKNNETSNEESSNGNSGNNNNESENEENSESVKNNESGLTKALKIMLGIISFLGLFACTFGAFVLEAKGDIEMPNFLHFVFNYLKSLDGSSFTVSVLGKLVFNLVIPIVMIIIFFIKQFIISIKIFKVGRNTNRGALWSILIDNLIGIFVIKLVSSIICKPCMYFNPLDLLMIPACINIIFYVFLYFFKLFRNEIGTFRFGKANNGKLIAHRIIQAITVILMFVLCMIMINLTKDGIEYSFKPFYGIRSFVNGTLDSYLVSESIVPNDKMMYLFVAVFEFGINLILMMFEVTILVYLLNTVYRFILRDVEEEYYNDCFYKDFKNKVLTCIVTLITLMVCKFVAIYVYLTSISDSVVVMNFSTCVSYLLPYLFGLGVVIVLSVINSILSNKWLKQVKE